MEEKNVKKISLRLYKVKTQLEALNDENLKPLIKEIESIDKDLLKENNLKFSTKMKKEILDFM
jgi:hypothetical protein